jgi:hypothetical protein
MSENRVLRRIFRRKRDEVTSWLVLFTKFNYNDQVKED